MPEAYLLLRPFDTTRPGLLVLDADGRRVASVSLSGEPDVDTVAAQLIEARTSPPLERYLVRVGDAAQASLFAKQLAKIEGVEAPALPTAGFVEIRARVAALTPAALAAAAQAAGVEAEIVDPVEVRLKAAREGIDPQRAAKTIPGLYQLAVQDASTTAWIHRWLLTPRALTARGLTPDIASVVYRFEDLPQGAAVVKHLRRPFALPGVLAVIPRVSEGAIEVVGRVGVHDEEATRAALVDGGLTLAGSPDAKR